MRVSPQLDQEELQAAVHAALADWNRIAAGNESPLGDLLIVQEKSAEYDAERNPLTIRRAVSDVLESAISELSVQDSNGAAVLRARFLEGRITRQVAMRMHASPDQVNRWQRTAIVNLSQLIYSRESARRKARTDQLRSSLPLSSPTHLFGCDEAISSIGERLLNDAGPFVVAITGIGGIGKTSLAGAVVRHVIPTLVFDEIVWLQASMNYQGELAEITQQSCEQILHSLTEKLGVRAGGGESLSEQMIRLRQSLGERSCLVIIDNLETEEQATAILGQVGKLVKPSKFLLTTRARPLISSPAFYYSVEELSFIDAAALLRQHALTIGTEALTAADAEVTVDIYQMTGGNPLALKLVVGLASVLPLEQILVGLEQSRPGPIEALYRHIYWEAWRTLGPEAQVLLQAMPLVAETGGLPNQMQAISNLSDVVFWPAVRELFSRSLLEVQGNVRNRRYSIHRLTETFLRTEIIDWPQL